MRFKTWLETMTSTSCIAGFSRQTLPMLRRVWPMDWGKWQDERKKKKKPMEQPQIKENFNDSALEFEAKISAPKSLEFTVYNQNQPVVQGVALAYPAKRGVMPEFYITAPQLGVNSYEKISGLTGNYAQFIGDYLKMMYDPTTGSFRMAN